MSGLPIGSYPSFDIPGVLQVSAVPGFCQLPLPVLLDSVVGGGTPGLSCVHDYGSKSQVHSLNTSALSLSSEIQPTVPLRDTACAKYNIRSSSVSEAANSFIKVHNRSKARH
ncbi:hypothetical protein TNCV_1725271 [Trichonephila clavipes]|nr:hypothetical protein TNCV_1725271 [Trichonephila clavipes]